VKKVYIVVAYDDSYGCYINKSAHTDKILAELCAMEICGQVEELDVDLPVLPGNLTEEN
jgi:hypothetical protein